MSHPVVLALFGDVTTAAAAARSLRSMGVPRERVSVVAKSQDEEGRLALAGGASPGSEIEESLPTEDEEIGLNDEDLTFLKRLRISVE